MQTTTSMVMAATLAAGLLAGVLYATGHLTGEPAHRTAGLQPAQVCANQAERYALSSLPPFYMTRPRCVADGVPN